jgi:uncharacterized protein YxeA
MRVLILLIVAAILIVAAAVLAAAPLKSVTYHESEPYITTETYYVTETQTEEIPLDYKIIGTKITNWYWRVSSDCSVTLKNTDSEGGYVRIAFDMATLATDVAPSRTVTKAAWQFLAPGKQEDVTVRHEGNYIGNLTYSITPPTKEVTTSQQVPKTREVINYREVEKTKKETLLEYWTG